MALSERFGKHAAHDVHPPEPLATFARMRSQPSRRRAAVGAIGAALLLLTATACASDSDDSSAGSNPPADVSAEVAVTTDPADATPAPTDADASAPTSAPAGGVPDTTDSTTDAVVVPEALQFTAPLVGGGTFDGTAVAGKPTVFWFWAPT